MTYTDQPSDWPSGWGYAPRTDIAVVEHTTNRRHRVNMRQTILAAVRAGLRTSPEIAKAVRLDPKTASALLCQLHGAGMVERERTQVGNRWGWTYRLARI